MLSQIPLPKSKKEIKRLREIWTELYNKYQDQILSLINPMTLTEFERLVAKEYERN